MEFDRNLNIGICANNKMEMMNFRRFNVGEAKPHFMENLSIFEKVRANKWIRMKIGTIGAFYIEQSWISFKSIIINQVQLMQKKII